MRNTPISSQNVTMTNQLIRILEGDPSHKKSEINLIDFAMDNKVLLELLRILDIQGTLRNAQNVSNYISQKEV